MALDTLAVLLSEVINGLGSPPEEWLPVEEALRAVQDVLALGQMELTQSNQNQSIRHKDFTPASRDKTLSDVEGVPAWVERLEGVSPNEKYIFIPTTNLSLLDEARDRGEARCAFYSEDGILHVRFSYNPQDLTYQSHRLWYDPDPALVATLSDPMGLPVTFRPYFAAQSRVTARTKMFVLAANCEYKPDEMLIKAWMAAQAEDKETIRQWRPLWQQHRLGGVAQRGRSMKSVLPSGVNL
ncbi:MAG: hypothetical protein JOZ52_08565 [Acidobacteria bacterium]|nr:hypothetical protein [Acidobacteriota bacterium]